MAKVNISKKFPSDYGDDVLEILKKMSFTDSKRMMILGSMSLRSQLYAGDYDGYEIVENEGKTKNGYLSDLAKQFAKNMKELEKTPLTYIGDIKCGEVAQWKILNDGIKIKGTQVLNYNSNECKQKVEYLFQSKIISEEEYNNIYKKLKNSLTIDEYFELKDLCKFHIIRWTPSEIIKGSKDLRNGSKVQLQQAIDTKGLCKMDVVGWVQNNRFTDFSVIYQFNFDGKPLNMVIEDIDYSLKENILSYAIKKNYFKMSKRLFALAKFKKNNQILDILSPLFNGDLGRIYQIYGDIGTLEYIVENEKKLPSENINFEIDQFRNRLSNLTLSRYLENETKIISVINHMLKLHKLDKVEMLKELRKLREYLDGLLSYYSKEYLEQNKLLPIPKEFLP